MNKKLEGALEALEVLDKTITPLLEPVLARYEDDLSDIITANYFVLKETLLKAQENEKEIAKYKQLEKDLGCPLKAIAHLVMNKPFYYKDPNGVLHQISTYDLINKKIIFYLNWEDINTYEDIEISLSDYSETFWLKEDRSE